MGINKEAYILKRIVALLLATLILCAAGAPALAQRQTRVSAENEATYEGEWVDMA